MDFAELATGRCDHLGNLQDTVEADHVKEAKSLLDRRMKKLNDYRTHVSFQWKNPDFLLKNVGFLFKNVDFLLNNDDLIINE